MLCLFMIVISVEKAVAIVINGKIYMKKAYAINLIEFGFVVLFA